MKRLFVAIKISPDKNFLEKYNFLKSNLKQDLIKWVEPDKLHLTLKFLGETEDHQIPKIKSILKEFTDDKKAFSIAFDNIGIFGSSYDPRVIWFGIEENHQIKSLGNDLLDKFDKNGFHQDRQNFVPHLSIGRIKKLNNKKHFQFIIDKVKGNFIQSIEINKIILFQSILKPSGPIYINQMEYRLTD